MKIVGVFDDKNLFKDELAHKEILEELNIKTCQFIKNPAEIIHYDIKPNFPVLKERFDSKMKTVISNWRN